MTHMSRASDPTYQAHDRNPFFLVKSVRAGWKQSMMSPKLTTRILRPQRYAKLSQCDDWRLTGAIRETHQVRTGRNDDQREHIVLAREIPSSLKASTIILMPLQCLIPNRSAVSTSYQQIRHATSRTPPSASGCLSPGRPQRLIQPLQQSKPCWIRSCGIQPPLTVGRWEPGVIGPFLGNAADCEMVLMRCLEREGMKGTTEGRRFLSTSGRGMDGMRHACFLLVGRIEVDSDHQGNLSKHAKTPP